MWNTLTTFQTDREKPAFIRPAGFYPTVYFLLRTPALICALVLFAGSGKITAQTMQLQITVEEEFSVFRDRGINPGVLPANEGWISIPDDSEMAGRLTISAEENVEIILTLDTPSELVRDSGIGDSGIEGSEIEGSGNTLPLRIAAAHTPDGGLHAADSIPFNGNTACFRLSASGLLAENMDPRLHRLNTHIYIYGEIYSGDVEPGVYYGDVGVRVEYH